MTQETNAQPAQAQAAALAPHETYDRRFWQDGRAGSANIVTYDGSDVRGVAYVEFDETRAELIAQHNKVVRAALAAPSAPAQEQAYEGEPDMHSYAARLERSTFEMRAKIEALSLELLTLKAAPASTGAGEAVTLTIDMVRSLPTIKAPEIDGEESDGTPRYWRSRPYVSLKALERLIAAHPAPSPVAQGSGAWQLERMRHIANEWADMATNGMQWLRNIRDGISTVDDALANLETNYAHCRKVNDAPGQYGSVNLPAAPGSEPAQGEPNLRQELARLSMVASTAMHQDARDQRNILEDIAEKCSRLSGGEPPQALKRLTDEQIAVGLNIAIELACEIEQAAFKKGARWAEQALATANGMTLEE